MTEALRAELRLASRDIPWLAAIIGGTYLLGVALMLGICLIFHISEYGPMGTFFALLGILVGRVSFSDLVLTIGSAEIAYGNFIQAVLNFLIMAFAVFCIVKVVNRFHRKKKEETPPPSPTAQEQLLAEIRDLLKERQA